MPGSDEEARPERPVPDEAQHDVEQEEVTETDEIIARQLDIPPEEVSQYVTDRWQNAQKSELVRDNSDLFFELREMRDKYRRLEERLRKLMAQKGGGDSDMAQLMQLMGGTSGGSSDRDLIKLIKELKPVLQPQQQQQEEGGSKMMKDLLPVILLSNRLGGSSDESSGNDLAELIRALKEFQSDQQDKEKVTMNMGGQQVDVPVEIALLMGQQQQGVTREDIQEIVQASQQQQPQRDPQELKREAKQELREEKEFWKEFFAGTESSDPEVEKEKLKQQTAQKQLEKDKELEKEKLKHKRQEVQAQQELVNAIMEPAGKIDQTTGRRKRNVEQAGAGAAQQYID